MGNDSISKTLIVAISVCLVCGILVALSAVGLKPLQQENARLYMQKNILSAAGLLEDDTDIKEAFKSVEPLIVNLETGATDNSAVASVADYDQRKAKKDPSRNELIPADKDIASLKMRAKYAKVYLVRDEQGELSTLILPIEGYGLWSTLYGFLALDADLNTVKGISFYEHAETPGLGGEVDNEKWKSSWLGKKIYDEQGQVAAQLKKGSVDPSIAYEAEHYVDGLSGATLTSRGVSNLIKYWLGQEGYGAFLSQLKTNLANGGV